MKGSRRTALRESILADCFVVARGAAGFTVEQAVGAEPDIDLRLAEDAEFLAGAAFFGLLALGADDFAEARS